VVERLVLKVNGREETVSASGETPLLYVLRNDLGLNGPKFGCGLAQCGACAVLMDGIEIRSCVTPVASVLNREITTS
jgi:nicotinate dehydrogenase subunit A